ncbi:MAG: RNA repair domain-containing protein [Acidobacteriota bacterium]
MPAPHKLRRILNRLRWDERDGPPSAVLVLRVRHGDAEAAEEVPFSAVVEILPAGVTLAGGIFIPYHRVVRATRGGELLWQQRGGKGAQDEG